MKTFQANQTLIYTTPEGKQIDTFAVFNTDKTTGLTHINFNDLQVPANTLKLHPKTIGIYHMPFEDAFSFEIFNKLREKYGPVKKALERKIEPAANKYQVIAKAS